MTTLSAWILSIMVMLVPDAPWMDTYEDTARAIAIEVSVNPLSPDYTDTESALVLVEFAYTESRFNPGALGDCIPGALPSVSTCQSLGLYAISKVHAPSLELLKSESSTPIARRLFSQSLRICRNRPAEERFAWYAAGGPDCSKGHAASRWRYWEFRHLLSTYPLL